MLVSRMEAPPVLAAGATARIVALGNGQTDNLGLYCGTVVKHLPRGQMYVVQFGEQQTTDGPLGYVSEMGTLLAKLVALGGFSPPPVLAPPGARRLQLLAPQQPSQAAQVPNRRRRDEEDERLTAAVPDQRRSSTSPPPAKRTCTAAKRRDFQALKDYSGFIAGVKLGATLVEDAVPLLRSGLARQDTAQLLKPWKEAVSSMTFRLHRSLQEYGAEGMESPHAVGFMLEGLREPLVDLLTEILGLGPYRMVLAIELESKLADAVRTKTRPEEPLMVAALCSLADSLEDTSWLLKIIDQANGSSDDEPSVAPGGRPWAVGPSHWEPAAAAPPAAPAQMGQGGQGLGSWGYGGDGGGQLAPARGLQAHLLCDMWDGQQCHFEQLTCRRCKRVHVPSEPSPWWEQRRQEFAARRQHRW